MTIQNRDKKGISDVTRRIPQRSGWTPFVLGVLALICFSSAPAFGQTWNGSASDLWVTGTNWNGNTAPNSSTAVVDILSATNNPVVLNASTSVSTLTMGSSTSLNVTAGVFTFYGASISNAGMISLDSQLQLNDSVTLSGAGTLTMVAGQFGTTSAGQGSTLTNQGTIVGYGLIGSNSGALYEDLSFSNSGTLNANSSGNTLFIEGDGSSITNSGKFEATGGGILDIAPSSGVVNDNNGKIIASGSGSTVEVSATIQGGTLSTASGGVIETVGTAGLDGLTNGAITLSNGSTYTAGSGTLTSIAGTLNLGTTAASTLALGGQLQLTANTTLSGPGIVTMTAGQIGTSSVGQGSILTNPSTIQGYGFIGSNSGALYQDLSFSNSGTVNANSSGNALTIEGDGNSITNSGTLEATNGGILDITPTSAVNDNNGKIIASGSGSTVEVSTTIQGGTLSTSNGGVMETAGTAALDGFTQGAITLSNGSTYSAGAGLTSIVGTLNLGTTAASTLALTGQLQLTGNTTLSGPGVLTMSGGPNVAQIGTSGAAQGSVLFNQSTIQGFGLIGSNVGSLYQDLSLNNTGTVNSNSSGNTLTIAGSGVITNTGLLEATGGGILDLTATNPVNNLNGNITANGSGSTVEVNNAIQGGTLNTLNGGVMETVGTTVLLDGSTQGAITLSDGSTYTAGAGTLTGITGTLNLGTNTGSTLALGGQLQLTGNTTLSGPGSLTMTAAQIGTTGGGQGSTLTNQSTIQGTGLIGSDVGVLYPDLNLTNSGTVNAVGGTLTIAGPGTTTNTGTMAVQSASTLDITNTFSNFNSGTSTLTGGTYNVNSGTFEFNGANIVNNAADIILTGSGSQVLNNTGNTNALANFDNNEAGGVFQLGAGRSFTTSAPGGGNFTNNGSLIIGGGDTFQVAGALSNFAGSTLTGGSYYVAGTLQFGASGSHLVTNDANLTLAGAGKLLNLGGTNLLNAFTTNDSGASFTVAGGGSYTTPGSFSNSGTMDLEQGSSLTVSGNLSNHGTVGTNLQNLQGGANTLTVTGTLTNNAAGTVTIGANNDTSDVANVGMLANSGTVTVGTGATLNLTSAATDTNSSSITVDGTMSVAPGSTFTNSGTLDVEDGKMDAANVVNTSVSNVKNNFSTINISGTMTNDAGGTVTVGTSATDTFGTLANSGTITVGTGSSLTLSAAGADSNTGSITVTDGAMSVASGGAFTNSGTLDLETKGTLTVTGNLTNSGTLTTNNSNLGGGANTITVTGTLTNDIGDSVTIGAHSDTADTASVGLLSNAGTVTVDKGATLKLTATGADSNTGSIALEGGSLSIASGGALTNSGTLDEETGGKLSVGGSLTNTGTLSTNAANLGGTATAITIAGKLTNSATGVVTIGANNDTADTATVGYIANSGNITVGTGAALTLSTATTDTNTGTIDVNGTLDIKAATTLSGTGSLTLTNGAITGLSAGPTLTNGSTIQGSGTISNLGITNAGTLSANQAGALIILPTAAGLDNTGTIKVSAGDTMQIGTSAGGALTNFASNTLTGGTYTLSGTLQFGASGTTIATNAANITLSGAGQMLDFGSNNILAGFNNNAAAGKFTLASAASLTTSGGSFTNAGVFSVGTGTTFTVGGSSFNFTQTAGSAVVNGTLTSTSLGTLSVNGGALDGTGTLGYNVVDASTLTPGDSASVTGKLTVADTYTQSSAGALDIQINGATAGTNYDQLKVTQGATLGGTLNISLGFTPTVGQHFEILTASTVSDTFTTVNGLAINGSEHFTITYQAGDVILTVVSGALTASSAASTNMLSHLIHPALNHLTLNHLALTSGSAIKDHYGLAISGASLARLPATVKSIVPAASLARIPVSFASPATGMAAGMHGFHAMDLSGSSLATSAPVGTGDASLAGSFGIAPVSAASYNSMSAMNHQRFECGVDLKALLKTSRKQLLKGLWAAPDSKDALSIGYMTYTGSH